ncbi:glycosyltransferase family 39 protein [Arthrobacter sp. ISL-30]|uniref:ArnT family glycosyltransferase n=1 Tax=Arthrobacter sp. ISL-30 TaxID=2819109 RepID=UPI001BE599EF|nr:glycosyltransferase family 39 protein [Arthrobacter sp. ISL-30]MBT2514369.1 glycosyltransferase family 39 protein [Arthrobacter sp. ISL-30]
MAGSQDWTAFLFGSSDPGNAITVDKPPLSLWIMSASVRLFGLSSWSILVPQALMGVTCVYLIYRVVQKRFDAATGLLAGLFMAITPTVTVIFRYNNPDALLTLLMVGTAACTLEAIDRRRPLWLIAAGTLTGAALLTKQLQAGLVLPAVALTYLLFAAAPLFKRFLHLLGALVAAALTAGWWVLLVQLTDPAIRPFIGGSRTNSIIELTLGYNGLDRLTGEDASRTMSGAAAGLDQKLDPGFQRFLQPQFSGQFGWFLPLAIAGLIVAIWWVLKRHGSIQQRALLLMCSVWFVCSTTILAYMSGIVHPYYTIASVPSLCCLASFAVVQMLRRLHQNRVRLALGAILLATMLIAFVSALRSTADFPWLPQVVIALWGVPIAAVFIPPLNARVKLATAVLVLAALLTVPALWTLDTVLSPHEGAGVVAGPSIRGIRTDHPDRNQLPADVPASFKAVMFGDVPATGVVQRLMASPPGTKWAAAMVGSETAANYQLESQRAILPVGGFDGTDPFPTLAQFQQMVSDGQVDSLVIQNLPPLTSQGRAESARIVEWVTSHYTPEPIDGASYYRLTP